MGNGFGWGEKKRGKKKGRKVKKTSINDVLFKVERGKWERKRWVTNKKRGVVMQQWMHNII